MVSPRSISLRTARAVRVAMTTDSSVMPLSCAMASSKEMPLAEQRADFAGAPAEDGDV